MELASFHMVFMLEKEVTVTLRKGKVFIFLAAVLVLAGGVLFLNRSFGSIADSDSKKAEDLIHRYFKAIQSNDVDQVISLVIDSRYKDPKEQREVYESASIEDILYSYRIISVVTSLDDGSYEKSYDVNVAISNKKNGEIEIALPVVKVNRDWKVLIKHLDLPAKK
ncbi:hypothetical protein NBRC13296_12085 [Paenibacillus chitinolyticus]|uniref:hypothetical protein n=1 Tax=Paenibacillus chitinolyticus TaxID=79263 RepID=UPI003559207D